MKMRQGKHSSVTAVALFIFIIASLKDGASGVYVDVFPKSPIVRLGQNFTFMCRVGKPLMYCSIKLPGFTSGLNMNENIPRTSNYWYAGESISKGQCGITIARMDDSHNGQFKCSLGFSDESAESDGVTNVTVARAPANDPELVVTPEADGSMQSYNENTPIRATCTVRGSRPPANILWFIGDDQITDGISRTETVESPNNLFTVQQNLSRKLTWKDSGKDLKCVVTHVALDGRTKQTIKQISVRFSPRPVTGTFEQFGFIVGEEGVISVQIHANPRPSLTWIVDQQTISEGRMDSTQRFQANAIQSMGNGTWEAVLRIMRVTPEDVLRKYILKARNEVGEGQYTVTISTSSEPQGSVELGTGPIIGIVVAILVLLIIIFMLIFARATGRWCFSGVVPVRHDNKESSDTESADHGPAEKTKKPRMNLTYILKKKKDKVAADAEDLKFQNVAMETDKAVEKPGTESSEHVITSTKGKPHGQDVVYAELDLQTTQRPVIRREDDKIEYAEILYTKPEEEGGGAH